MADVVPPPTTPPVASSSSPPTPPILTILNPPPALTRAPLGTQFEGRAIAPPTQGSTPVPIQGQYQIQIQTPLGTLTAQSPLPVPNHAALALVLQSLGGSPQLLLTSLNGKPLTLFTPRGTPVLNPLAGGSTVAQATSTLGSQPVTQLTQGTTVSATLLSPSLILNAATPLTLNASAPPILIKGAPLVQPGPSLVGQTTTPGGGTPGAIINRSPTGGQVSSGKSSTLASGQFPLDTNANRVSTATNQPGLTSLPAGTQATVRITTLQPPIPGAPIVTPTATGTIASGQILNGIVSRSTPQGHPIVTTHTGIFSLATRTALLAGTQVTFEILGNLSLPPAPKNGAGHILTTLHGAKTWPEMTEALHTLTDVNPAAAQQVINSVIPRLDAQLTTNIIFFLAALRGGDLRSWLGEGPTSILQRAKPGLVARLGDNFSQMARISEEPAAGEWRGTPIPFLNGAEVEQIFLYTQRHNEDENSNDEKSETRFVVDVTLTNLGRLQLDGFLHQGRKHFDLIFRSESPLPAAMPEDIRNIFVNAAGITGMQGGISFQAAPPNFIELVPPGDQDDSFGVTV
jgi:hypothetical protein